MDFAIGKQVDKNGKLFEANYQNKNVLMKQKLKQSEIVPYLNRASWEKYNFLPQVYTVFSFMNSQSLFMEILYPFDFEKSEIYIDSLFDEFERFQRDTKRYRLNISPLNIRSRENGEIVLDNLWSDRRNNMFISDTIQGNKNSLYNSLMILKYQDQIKDYVLNMIDYIKSENLENNLSKYGLDTDLLHHYERTDDPIDLNILAKNVVALFVYIEMKNIYQQKNIDIRTVIPPINDEDEYWQNYNAIEKKYEPILQNLNVLYLIVPNATLHSLKYNPIYDMNYDNYETLGFIVNSSLYNPIEEFDGIPLWYYIFIRSNDPAVLHYIISDSRITSNLQHPMFREILQITKAKGYNSLTKEIEKALQSSKK